VANRAEHLDEAIVGDARVQRPRPYQRCPWTVRTLALSRSSTVRCWECVNEDIDGWVVIGSEPGLRQLAFQRVTSWIPPRQPDPGYPQQMHLDIRVADADQAEQELLALGATRAPGGPETGFRVFTDPAGHPFCIVFGRHSPS
jgi:hypothetical protein